MHTTLRTYVLFLAAILSIALGVGRSQSSAMQSDPIVLKPDEIHWTENASGVRVAVLQGDPDQPGPFTLRLEYPPGYRKPPHYHPRDAYVTVLSGSYYRGYGNAVDESQAIKLTPGTFSVNPAGVSHYEWTTQSAVLQVHATGPWSSTYVDTNGRPRTDTSAP